MRRLILIGAVLLSAGLAGCSWFRDPPRADITTGATVVYNGGPGGELFSVCDKGNLVYLTKSQPAVAIVKDGCNPSAQEHTLAQVAAWRAIAERPPERLPVATPTAAPPPHAPLPQPLLVQLVPTAAPAVEARAAEPVIVQIQPAPTCPACPVAPPLLTPQATPAPAPRKAAPRVVVSQLDPNTASTADIERLPGVTAQQAAAIARGRPYRTLHDLVDRKALTESEYQALAPYFVIR